MRLFLEHLVLIEVRLIASWIDGGAVIVSVVLSWVHLGVLTLFADLDGRLSSQELCSMVWVVASFDFCCDTTRFFTKTLDEALRD